MDWSDQAIAGNLDLQQATLRLQAVRIVAGTSIRASCRKSPPAPSRCRMPLRSTPTSNAGIEAIWDLGLFGAAESAQLSAQASAATRALRGAAQVAVIADVVRSYLDLTVAQAQQDLLARQQAVDDRGEQLALVRQRLRLDEPGELDRLRARQAATRAATAQARENADNAARALALLLDAMARTRLGVPIARRRRWVRSRCSRSRPICCAHRPQILLAESEVMQAAASKGSARAAMYPRVSLGGSILYAYNLTQNARSNSDSSPSIARTIDIPLWDWGQRRARFHADEKQLDAALLGYRKAVLEGGERSGRRARQPGAPGQQHPVAARGDDAAGQQVKRQRGRCSWGCPANSTGLTGSVRHSPRRPT